MTEPILRDVTCPHCSRSFTEAVYLGFEVEAVAERLLEIAVTGLELERLKRVDPVPKPSRSGITMEMRRVLMEEFGPEVDE